MSDDAEVLVRIEGTIGRLTLNRPKAINALNQNMVHLINAALDAWENDDAVRCILIDGAGDRGFCAGGDIRALWDSARIGGDLPAVFLAEEYRLNLRIATSRKPFVALMDGIVMGGGVGLSAHAAHRVVTERTMIAMPETNIGFIPDVGGTYLLSRAPGELGTHLALTAGRCNGADAILCGLADMYIPSGHLAEIPNALQGLKTAQDIAASLTAFAETPTEGPLTSSRTWIDPAYAGDDAETIVDRLTASDNADAHMAAAAITRNSPSSVKLSLRALREAKLAASLAPCLQLEYRLALATTSAPDFIEGIRAQVVDKDRNPRWSPQTLQAVTAEMVDQAFALRPGSELTF